MRKRNWLLAGVGVVTAGIAISSLLSSSVHKPSRRVDSSDYLPLLDLVHEMRFELPERNLPLDLIQSLTAPGFAVQNERLSPDCIHLRWNPKCEQDDWLCLTRFPVDLGGGDEGAGELDPQRYRVRQGGVALTLEAPDEDCYPVPGKFAPTRRGFRFATGVEQRQKPFRPDYVVDYPVASANIRGLNYAHAHKSGLGFIVNDVGVYEDHRRILYAPAPTQLTFPVRILPDTHLTMGIAALEEAWLGSDGIRFEVAVRGSNGHEKRAFTRVIQPTAPDQQRWIDVDIDLGPFAGEAVELTLKTGPGPRGNSDFDFAAFANPILYRATRQRPPVIILDIDTLRPDHLEAYGYARPTSPVLQQFAREAVVFDQAIAQSNWTLPSQMSILTGLYPSHHNVRRIEQTLAPDVATLATQLQDDGYLTKAITDGGSIAAHFGFNRGFDSYADLTDQRGGRSNVLSGVMHRFRVWLADSWKPPNLLLLLHTYATHDPYDASAANLSRFDPDYAGDVYQRFRQLRAQRFTASAREREHLIARYDAQIFSVDTALGEVFAALREHNLYDSAVIVVISDHGEEFGAHGNWTHGHSLSEALLKVPMMIRFPGGAFGGRRIASLVETVDLVPTLLDFLGLPTPPGLDGRSLLGLIRDPNDPGHSTLRYAIAEKLHWRPEGVAYEEWFAVRGARHKLVQKGRDKSFYSLADDPEENNNIYDANDETVQRFTRVLDSYRSGRAEAAPQATVSLTDTVREQLRALGYLEDR